MMLLMVVAGDIVRWQLVLVVVFVDGDFWANMMNTHGQR